MMTCQSVPCMYIPCFILSAPTLQDFHTWCMMACQMYPACTYLEGLQHLVEGVPVRAFAVPGTQVYWSDQVGEVHVTGQHKPLPSLGQILHTPQSFTMHPYMRTFICVLFSWVRLLVRWFVCLVAHSFVCFVRPYIYACIHAFVHAFPVRYRYSPEQMPV